MYSLEDHRASTLVNICLETGYTRYCSRSEIKGGAVKALRRPLRKAMARKRPTVLGDGWRAKLDARADSCGAQCLDGQLWAPGVKPGAEMPSLTMAVIAPPSFGAFPILTTSMLGLLGAPDPPTAFHQGVELQRSLAWTWIETLPPPEYRGALSCLAVSGLHPQDGEPKVSSVGPSCD